MATKREAIDEDSPMQDESPSVSDDEFDPSPQTPHRPSANQLSSDLSPPDSQSRPGESSIPANTANKMSTSASINANGKRKWATNGESASSNVTQGLALAQAQSGGATAMIMGRDPNSGYTWTREEDAPGHFWNNQKAKEEASREFSRFADKDRMIKDRYGDVLGK
ncbi:Invertase 2 [Venturia inaequalis]|nr:Invertase 2 [Venturia inaequalis]